MRGAWIGTPAFILTLLQLMGRGRYAFIWLLTFPAAIVAAAETDDAFGTALRTFVAELQGATYFVPGWTPAQRSQEIQLREHDALGFRFERCTEPIEPAKCDGEHKWRHYDQTLMLTRLRPRSVKVLEVSGAVTSPGAPDTNHALVYRCLQNLDCTSGDLGPNARPPIPCRDHDSCDRARATLEELIALAQAKPAAK